MTDLPPDDAANHASGLVALLTSPEAQAALTDLAAFPDGDPVATATRLRKRFAPEIVAATLTLYALRTRAVAKFSHAGDMLFTRPGYEQASSEPIARWRAQRFAGCRTIADLCCGIGGDLQALASLPDVELLVAVDVDADHLAMATANARLVAPAMRIDPLLADVRSVDLDGVDGVFIDPARRDAGGRFGPGETEPPLEWCLSIAERVPRVGIKLAPGIEQSRIPAGWELEMIATDSDLKEAMLWSPALATAPRRATVITASGVDSLSGEGDDPDATASQSIALATPDVGLWLHDPNPAITRAGLVQTLAATVHARPIDRQIAFLVGASAADSPFARSRRIVASQPWDERTLRATLDALQVGSIDIRRRGLAGDVEAIARRLRKRLPKQGRRAVWIAMTRLDDRPWAIVCEESPRHGPANGMA